MTHSTIFCVRLIPFHFQIIPTPRFQRADETVLLKGKDIPEFFPDVVKTVVARSIEVKKIVYICLVHYADFNDTCREIALPSINSFQTHKSGRVLVPCYSLVNCRFVNVIPLSAAYPTHLDTTDTTHCSTTSC